MNWAPVRCHAEIQAEQAQMRVRHGLVEVVTIITVVRVWLGVSKITKRLTVKWRLWMRWLYGNGRACSRGGRDPLRRSLRWREQAATRELNAARVCVLSQIRLRGAETGALHVRELRCRDA